MVWQLTYQNTPALKNTYVFQSVTASDLCRQYLIEPQFELQEYGKKVINRLGFEVCIILYISSGFPYIFSPKISNSVTLCEIDSEITQLVCRIVMPPLTFKQQFNCHYVKLMLEHTIVATSTFLKIMLHERFCTETIFGNFMNILYKRQ